MPLSRLLLLVSGVAGALSVAAALFAAPLVSLQCGLVTLATFTGYAIVAGRLAAPRVRWALAVGVGLFAVAIALRLSWNRGPSAFGAPGALPDRGGDRSTGSRASPRLNCSVCCASRSPCSRCPYGDGRG